MLASKTEILEVRAPVKHGPPQVVHRDVSGCDSAGSRDWLDGSPLLLDKDSVCGSMIVLASDQTRHSKWLQRQGLSRQ